MVSPEGPERPRIINRPQQTFKPRPTLFFERLIDLKFYCEMATAAVKDSKSLNVLLIGNNPTEMGSIYDLLKKVKKREMIADMAVDLKKIFLRIAKFRPNFILVDDGLTRMEIKKLIGELRGNKETENIPVAVLKSSNYSETLNDGVSDFILKEGLSSENLYHSIRNSISLHRTYRYLNVTYKRRAKQLSAFFRKNMGL